METRSFRAFVRVVAISALGSALMLAPCTANAATQPAATSRLSVWIDGWGSGTVTSSPAGINCRLESANGNPYENDNWYQTLSGPCEVTFPVGTVVTVTSTPATGSNLNSSDCGAGSMENPCRRTVTSGYNAVYVMFCPRDDLCMA